MAMEGIQGSVGPQGPAGPQGPRGPQGPQGIQGIPGEVNETAPAAFLARADGSTAVFGGNLVGPDAWVLLTSACMNTEVLDSDNAYNLTIGRFQPSVRGYYFIMATGGVINVNSTDRTVRLMLNRNGNLTGNGRVISPRGIYATNWQGNQYFEVMTDVSGMMYFNGTTDYVEVRISHSSNVNFSAATTDGFSIFSGFLIRAT